MHYTNVYKVICAAILQYYTNFSCFTSKIRLKPNFNYICEEINDAILRESQRHTGYCIIVYNIFLDLYIAQ